MNYLQNLVFRGGKSIGLLLLLFLLLGNGGVWAQNDDTETITLNSKTEVKGTDVTFKFAANGGTVPFLTTQNKLRLYPKNTLTVSSTTKKIAKIEFNFIVNKSGKGLIPQSFKADIEPKEFVTITLDSKNAIWNTSDENINKIVFTIAGTAGNLEFSNAIVTYVTTSSDPSITAKDVTYAADITSGEIPYTINNPVGDNKISASLVGNCDWITDIDATTTPNKVTFKLDENTSTEPRTAQIMLEYEGAKPKIVTVTQRGVVAKHNVTWSVNGVETTEQVEEGTAITFATPTENIPEGYVFKGWYGSTLEPQDVAPEYVTSAIAMADVTYYAVFAKSNGGGEETATLRANHIKSNTTYDSHTYNDDKNNTWSSNNTELLENSVARYGMRNTSGSHFESPEFSGNVTKIVMDVYNGSSSDRTFYIDSKKESQSGDLGMLVAPKGEKLTSEHEVVLKGTQFKKFYINVSAALGFSYIKVTYSSEVFTDFRTSVTAPTTATITLAEACTDGTKYYGTYSNSKAFIVPEDLEVAKISVDNGGKLTVTTYGKGTIVPANTGVMVSSNTVGEHTVTLSDEVGESVLGNDNMLRPTGDNGITAEEMATNDANCKYYRLTMHNGETLGFFYGAADGAAFKVLANKAYLAVPAETAAKMSSFVIGGGSTTAIDGIEAGNGANASRKVYNLQGQRVSGTLPKGLYIIDGRKVIVK